MSLARRISDGMRAVATNPVERRSYVARAKWLLSGSGALPAWSLEYRAGLIGAFSVQADRLAADAEASIHCPTDCSAHAPLAHLYLDRHVFGLHDTVASTATGATLAHDRAGTEFFVRESITWPFESILSHGLEIPEARTASPGPPGRAIVFPTTTNYYHWLIEDLPAVLRAHMSAPDATLVSFASGVTERHRVVAEHLGAPLAPSPLVLRLDDHVLAGRSDDSWFIHPTDARLLREFGTGIAASSDRPQHQRIYVSRRGASRSISGEAELEGILRAEGFHVAHLERTPWPEQVALFRGARIVVGLHGAGLANLAFTDPGATLVELTNSRHYNRCFEFLSHVAGHDYQMIQVDGDDHASPRALASQILGSA